MTPRMHLPLRLALDSLFATATANCCAFTWSARPSTIQNPTSPALEHLSPQHLRKRARDSKSHHTNSHRRAQWVIVIALVVMAAAATKRKSTSATTAHSNTIPTLHHNVTTTLVHRLARPHIARLARLHPSMASLETRTEIGVASLSEALLADRATDPSRTSHSTHLDREHQMALRLTVHKARARGPEGSTETTVALVTQAEVQAHRVVAAAASDPSQHTTALF
jgi:hypothetical protein